MKLEHEFTAADISLSEKPSGYQAGIISKSLTRRQSVEEEKDLDIFLDALVTYGMPWSPAVFDGSRSNENWRSASILALDFDSGLPSSKAIERIESKGIKPNIVYYTFSHREDHHKYRMMFFLDMKITDPQIWKYYMTGLGEIFPEADEGCFDLSHYYYGGKDGFVNNREEIDAQLLENVIDAEIISNDSGKTRKITAESNLSSKSYVWRKVNTPNSNYRGIKNSPEYEEYLSNRRYNDFDFEKVKSRVKIFRDFCEGKWLHHPEIFGLATSLYWVGGGLKFMKKTMQKWTDDPSVRTSYTDNNFHALKSVRKKQYTPKHLSNYSPYPEDSQHINLIEAERDQIRGVKVVEQRNKLTLQKAEQVFQYEFRKTQDSMGTDLNIFRTATGLGKTRELITTDSNTLLAFKTHALKQEFYEKDGFGSHHAIMTPQLPDFDSEKLNQRLSRLYQLGYNKQAYKLLSGIAEGWGNEIEVNARDRRDAEEYMNKKKEIYVTDKKILTTHEWALHNAHKLEQIDHIIFDEDPISTVTPQGSIKIPDLTELAIQTGEKIFRNKDVGLLDLVKYLTSEVEPGQITELPLIWADLDLDKMAESYSMVDNIDSTLIDFLNSDAIYRDPTDPAIVHHINKYSLPEDTKISIMSATAHTTFWKTQYGARVNMHTDLSNIEQKGKIVQHLGNSFSRVSLKNKIEQAKALQDGSPVITFMKEKSKFKDADDQCHFGNCSGYDHLKGAKIKCIGTPHQNNSRYLLLAAILNIPIKHENNRKFGRKNVEFNGLQFNFSTFVNNDRLSQIQLELIHAETLQAVGRARCLREETAQVDLYSNFPLRISNQYNY